jgi:hypothetical protein
MFVSPVLTSSAPPTAPAMLFRKSVWVIRMGPSKLATPAPLPATVDGVRLPSKVQPSISTSLAASSVIMAPPHKETALFVRNSR